MAKVTFDWDNKLIIVNSGITSVDVKIDLYSDWKEWVLLGNNSSYLPAFRVSGWDNLWGWQYVWAFFFLLNGWKIRPYEGNHTLTVTGNLRSEDLSSPYTSTLGAYNVNIQTEFSSLTLQVDPTWGTWGWLTSQQNSRLMWLPLLTDIEGSTILAKEETVQLAVALSA